MNAVQHIPQDTLEAALAQFNLGTIVRCVPVTLGIENSNYFVETQVDGHRREYVLTILEQTPYAGDSYQPMMQSLHQAGLPVAAPIADTQGDFYGLFTLGASTTKPFLVQPKLPGKHIFNPTDGHLSALGRFLGRMHSTHRLDQLKLPPYPRDAQWLSTKQQQINGYLGFADQQLMQEATGAVIDLLARADVAALPQGIVHGDLFRDNVLFNSNALSAVLDFHHAAHGFLIYDLAVTANDWCNDNSGYLNQSRLMQLLRAYHQQRPLAPEEIWLFPLFCLYAGLAFWQSRMWVRLPGQRQARSKNPLEFRNIVARHLRQPCYLDYRLL